jgi:hypothetical protein
MRNRETGLVQWTEIGDTIINKPCKIRKKNYMRQVVLLYWNPAQAINPLSPELNPICYLLTLLAHDFLYVSRIRVKSLNLRLLMSYIYIYVYIYIWSTYS